MNQEFDGLSVMLGALLHVVPNEARNLGLKTKFSVVASRFVRVRRVRNDRSRLVVAFRELFGSAHEPHDADFIPTEIWESVERLAVWTLLFGCSSQAVSMLVCVL